MRKLTVIAFALMSSCFFYSCGQGGNEKSTTSATPEEAPQAEVPESIAEGKGIGEIKELNLEEELDPEMIKMGKSIYDLKCSACHKLTDQRVVGPGFQGVTNRRKPEWILNMITNVDVMLEKDPTAQALLEECLTRMPNQNVSISEARSILEFFRNNDMEKTGKKDGAIS